MSFTRNTSDIWSREIPGARWFKADLHIHTIDDHAGGYKTPKGLSGSVDDPSALSRYARLFLQGAIAKDVRVIALTPHSPRAGTSPGTSAVWKIINEWNSGTDDDGVPFRDKIYAVFPGFEPNVKDGKSGVHLLFLFDPEIGEDNYLRLFDAIMNARSPWLNGNLQMTPRGAKDLFQTIDQNQIESQTSNAPWSYLVLAPHFQGDHGILKEVQKQVLETFPCDRLAGYELGDSKLPDDFTKTEKPGSFLLPFMGKHRQAFFHSSDASSVDHIGELYTWLKLASPHIEALRQAFIASDSRIRIGFTRNKNGKLTGIQDPPDVTENQRPWLKSVTIQGPASFFGKEDTGKKGTRFELSPDLTCIIGGSMTGKSTFLDGLRHYMGAPLPTDPSLKEQVDARGRQKFLAGSPDVEIECPGSDPTAPLSSQWPAVFYAQNELQRLTQTTAEIENILARLVPAETNGIESSTQQMRELDLDLTRKARQLAGLEQQAADAEQAFERAKRAKEKLAAFSQAGVDKLHEAGRTHQSWKDAEKRTTALTSEVENILQSASKFEVPKISNEFAAILKSAGIAHQESELAKSWSRFVDHLKAGKNELESWIIKSRTIQEAARVYEEKLRIEVDHKLAEFGFDAGRLQEFQALNKQASLLQSYEANYKEARNKLESAQKQFSARIEERKNLEYSQREAFDRVLKQIEIDFRGRIRATRIGHGNTESLDDFIKSFGKKGITRWWNDIDKDQKPDPETLLEALGNGTLDKVNMSSAVQETFQETLTKDRKTTLAAIRCSDLYILELRMDDNSYRRLDALSGGQRVSVLLTLLLETTDNCPLVIDQPEDELDNRFLFETVLPALKKLKGRRQVIMATHNANIVVNGDADMVIQLEATANHGHVAHTGAIEDQTMRDTIVRTVDGGDEAFRLRRLKYGF